MAVEHTCPYNGETWQAGDWYPCGEHGWLCDRCKEDRADKRYATLAWAVLRGDTLETAEAVDRLETPDAEREGG